MEGSEGKGVMGRGEGRRVAGGKSMEVSRGI